MDRRKFVTTGCRAGLGFYFVTVLSEGCSSLGYYAQVTVEPNKVKIRKSEFQYLKKEKVVERQYVFVKPANAAFPICLYKSGESYTACLMRCTHQGCEVEVHGSRYVCPCHGSEFSIAGAVLEGPAAQPLITFKTTQDEEFIHIWVP